MSGVSIFHFLPVLLGIFVTHVGRHDVVALKKVRAQRGLGMSCGYFTMPFLLPIFLGMGFPYHPSKWWWLGMVYDCFYHIRWMGMAWEWLRNKYDHHPKSPRFFPVEVLHSPHFRTQISYCWSYTTHYIILQYILTQCLVFIKKKRQC